MHQERLQRQARIARDKERVRALADNSRLRRTPLAIYQETLLVVAQEVTSVSQLVPPPIQ